MKDVLKMHVYKHLKMETDDFNTFWFFFFFWNWARNAKFLPSEIYTSWIVEAFGYAKYQELVKKHPVVSVPD